VCFGLVMCRRVQIFDIAGCRKKARADDAIEQTDFNTGEFTDNVREELTIDLQRFSVKV
jgi:hypothetical protein